MSDDKKLHDIEKMDFVNIQSSRRRVDQDTKQNLGAAERDKELVDKLVADAPKKPKKSSKSVKPKGAKAVAKLRAPKQRQNPNRLLPPKNVTNLKW